MDALRSRAAASLKQAGLFLSRSRCRVRSPPRPRAATSLRTEPTGSQQTRVWLEIRSDNTILARTGRAEIGTGMSAFYPQMIAEELRVHPDCITLVMGDTDKTPDGGYSAGFLSGAANVRKVAAYTYQALLGLAATQLGVPASALTVNDGMVSGGGKSISYGQLVRGSPARSKDSGHRLADKICSAGQQ